MASIDASDELRPALEACRRLIVWAFIFGGGVSLLYLAPSLFMMQVYDRVLTTGGLQTLVFVSVVLAFALLSLALLDAMRTRLLTRISLRLDQVLAPRLLEASLRRDLRAGDARRWQALREFDSLRQIITGPAATAVMDAPWAPLYLLVCFLIHPLIGVVTLLGGAALVLIAIRNERALRRTMQDSAEIAPRIYAAQEADGANAEAVRALGMRRALIERQLSGRAQLNDATARTAFGSVRYTALTKFLRLALQSSALGVGAYLAVERQISPGALIACSILASRTLQPLEQIVGAWRQIGQARGLYASINQTLASAPPAPARTIMPAPRGELRFERVILRAPEGPRLMLADINFTLSPGEVLGVIGPSGAGKSSLARVAAGALAPDGGIVRLDGANIADWEPDALGRHIGYLPQDIGMLAGSVAENIRRFAARDEENAGAIDAATIAAAVSAGAHDMILRLPKGYDTPLGPGGRGVSLGQAQRLALARALYGAPVLIVLDEPNAHLDAEGEACLVGAIRQAKARGAGILVVAHRAGVVGVVDRLLVLREGKLEVSGGRDDILRHLAGDAPAPIRLNEARA